ncbi:MAG: hypothetical protein Tsb0024_00190 [Ruegeria sp.]
MRSSRLWEGESLGRMFIVSSGLMDDATIHALNHKQAKLKIMLWASGARRSLAKLIKYVLYD